MQPYLPPELVDCIQNAKENPTTQDKPSDLAERAVTLAREFIDKEYFRGFLLYVFLLIFYKNTRFSQLFNIQRLNFINIQICSHSFLTKIKE